MKILLVEDNPADARLVKDAVTECPGFHHVYVVEDGMEAMAWLRREGDALANPRPDLILLDLNLPRKDGRAVLREVKADPAIRSIPVIVLTSTQAEQEVRLAYDHGAAAYCIKPHDLDEYLTLIHRIVEFWSQCARLVTA